MRSKFGKSGGLGSGSFGSAGIGSDPNYRAGSGSGSGGSGGGGTNAAGEWFASAAKATSDWTAKVGEDVKNAKVADKLKSGWSWFTQGATAVIDKAKVRCGAVRCVPLCCCLTSPGVALLCGAGA
jgi:hypothetical protein